MNANNPVPLSGLARRLVQDGILEEKVARDALQESRTLKRQFVAYIVERQFADSSRIAEAASDEFGTPLLDLAAFNMETCPKTLVDPKLVEKHHTIPLFKRANRLYLAVSDPTNLHALDEIKFHTGISTEAILVDEGALMRVMQKFLKSAEEATGAVFTDLDAVGLEDLDIEGGEPKDDAGDIKSDTDDTPIVRFVNKVLLDAIRGGASDIHFEPYEKYYRIRYRTDGILHEVSKPPINLAPKLAARLKVMSQMDISERRMPQDGRIKMKLSKTRAIDFRVNTLPTIFGEKVVMRILDPASAQLGIEALGFEPEQRELYMKSLFSPQGMMLFTGPTGSGKTVSMYTGLGILNTDERNISTAEDPVEINMAGINQVHVNARVGLTFAEALRSFLRQDPDVIMVGEVRDLATAEIAVKAAQTGHMVMSTLHTNSACETITRLLNMGVAPFNVATSVNLIIAQRLGRRLCTHCAKELVLPRELMLEEGFLESELMGINLKSPGGCDKCLNGYKGRVGIYEVVPVTEELSEIIMAGGNAIELSRCARRQGYPDLRRAALIKAAKGLTSLEEVNRVTKD
ncbi:MAG: type IV-A pilus assembly ATPase PilB [Pseudomonadales bacterium]|jgi:type IV pilus assembly protein PilB|nr:type IV-A pilus assembly ATPase PilB [Gammaproteobacteria bacterium]MBP6053361.1 type IV-A pilus assembly ATPase PilB [Pseudomonadales bacterium]MBK6583509.1 type IV-A pilus assembly ATPase PilB [Gammaproteobacteria bacterium]MBK7521847.1 type IV-A pilus assembly ATPase PilB [Gammaproteobacteria bacterium]MBK9665319.1 type IV-A pilus assembly ATPase PilB [Gammaproteobacteria bacterium]